MDKVLQKQLAEDAKLAQSSDESVRQKQLEALAELAGGILQEARAEIEAAQTVIARLSQVLARVVLKKEERL